jgi:hypothetical protein
MEVEQGVRETDRDRRMEIAGGGPRSLTYTATLLAPRQQAAGAVINGPPDGDRWATPAARAASPRNE